MKPVAQLLPFWMFSKIANPIKLVNHGRQWEVFIGFESLGFSDAITKEEAKLEVHKREVNNALYAHENDDPLRMEKVLPSALVLDEYPDLKVKFPNASQMVEEQRHLVDEAFISDFDPVNSNYGQS